MRSGSEKRGAAATKRSARDLSGVGEIGNATNVASTTAVSTPPVAADVAVSADGLGERGRGVDVAVGELVGVRVRRGVRVLVGSGVSVAGRGVNVTIVASTVRTTGEPCVAAASVPACAVCVSNQSVAAA